ncbi:MAG: redoxin domain-containing protein [Polyangiales bacterium]
MTLSRLGALGLSLILAATPLHADPGGTPEAPGFLGAQLDAVPGGVAVRSVVGGGPAARAGVRAGDVIVLARGLPPGDPELLTRSVRAAGAGSSYALAVRRGRERVSLNVTLGAVPARRSGPPAVGSTPPPLDGATVVSGSDSLDLSSHRGRVVVLDFWASWCGPCQMMMPSLNRISQRFRAQGLTVIGLTDDPPNVIRSVGARMNIGYTLASSPNTMASYGVQSLPTLVLIDRGGHVRSVSVGFESPAALERAIAALVNERP